MAGNVVNWALYHGPRNRGQRLVLIAIADAANRQGEHAHPGLANIADASLYSTSQVKRLIGQLVEGGWLVVEQEGKGRGNATVYRCMMEGTEKGSSRAVLPVGKGLISVGKGLISDGKGLMPLPENDPHPEVSTPDNLTLVGAPPEAPKQKRPHRLPDDFALTDAMRAWAAEHTFTADVEVETEKFKDYWRSRAQTRVDWVASWRVWMRNAIQFSRGQQPQRQAKQARHVARDAEEGVLEL